MAVFNGHIPLFGTLYLYIYFGVAVLAIVIVIGAALIKRDFNNRISRSLRVKRSDQFIRALRIAVYSLGGYTVISGLAAAVVASSSAGSWNPAYPGVQLVTFLTAIWVSVVSLIPILLLVARAVPDFGQETLPDKVGISL